MALFRCPTCGRKFHADDTTAMPFCSQRCRTIDLALWLDEQQSLPVDPEPEDDEYGEQAG